MTCEVSSNFSLSIFHIHHCQGVPRLFINRRRITGYINTLSTQVVYHFTHSVMINLLNQQCDFAKPQYNKAFSKHFRLHFCLCRSRLDGHTQFSGQPVKLCAGLWCFSEHLDSIYQVLFLCAYRWTGEREFIASSLFRSFILNIFLEKKIFCHQTDESLIILDEKSMNFARSLLLWFPRENLIQLQH